MAAYKDSKGNWYVSVYYDNWQGTRSRKVKRGFATKREALEWEREFLQKGKGDLDMTFEAFSDIYKKDLNFFFVCVFNPLKSSKIVSIAASCIPFIVNVFPDPV